MKSDIGIGDLIGGIVVALIVGFSCGAYIKSCVVSMDRDHNPCDVLTYTDTCEEVRDFDSPGVDIWACSWVDGTSGKTKVVWCGEVEGQEITHTPVVKTSPPPQKPSEPPQVHQKQNPTQPPHVIINNHNSQLRGSEGQVQDKGGE